MVAFLEVPDKLARIQDTMTFGKVSRAREHHGQHRRTYRVHGKERSDEVVSQETNRSALETVQNWEGRRALSVAAKPCKGEKSTHVRFLQCR